MIYDLADIYKGIAADPRILYREPTILIVALIPFFAVFAVFVLWLVVFSIQNHLRQGELVRSGACEAVQEALYTPSGYMRCMAYNDKGVCTFQMWVQPSPYMRTLWQCPDESFWRRSGS